MEASGVVQELLVVQAEKMRNETENITGDIWEQSSRVLLGWHCARRGAKRRAGGALLLGSGGAAAGCSGNPDTVSNSYSKTG